MTEFVDQCTYGDGFLFIDIVGADFGLGSISHGLGHYFGHGVNGSIEPREISGRFFRIGRTFAKKIMATGAATGTG